MGGLLSHAYMALGKTGLQIVSVLGVFAVLGVIIHLQERAGTRLLMSAFSPRAVIYSTGWIGTPVHELSHYLAAVVFGHKVDEVSLFNPDPETGLLGYVVHRWNPGNPYHVVGNFFIGIAPIIGGSAVMYAAFYFLLFDGRVLDPNAPAYQAVLSHPSFVGGVGRFFMLALWIGERLFTVDNLLRWQFWVFIYLVFSVGMHMAPSPVDMKGAVWGFMALVFIIFMVNFAVSFTGGLPFSLSSPLKRFLSPVAAIMLLAVVMNFFNLGISFVLALAFRRW